MPDHDLRVAIYARVSGEQQAKEDTIDSQLEALTRRIASDDLECDPELRFVDDGYSGTVLARPGLERLRLGGRPRVIGGPRSRVAAAAPEQGHRLLVGGSQQGDFQP